MLEIGKTYSFTVRKDGEEVTFTGEVISYADPIARVRRLLPTSVQWIGYSEDIVPSELDVDTSAPGFRASEV